jgi:hypothetical protein
LQIREWDKGHTPLLNTIAHICDEHLRLRDEARCADQVRAAELSGKDVEARALARLALAEFGLIDRSRIRADVPSEPLIPGDYPEPRYIESRTAHCF